MTDSSSGYEFSEDARVAVFQARHEALALEAPYLEPAHLALGVLKTLSRFQRAACFARPEEFDRLCATLGAGPEPAPLIPQDIQYSEAAKAAMAGAIRIAAETGATGEVFPFHILLGILAPCGLEDRAPQPAGEAAAALAAAGLGARQVEAHLGWPPPGG